MLKNYILVALRNLIRQKGYASINIIGLALGLACSMLIALWVIDELSIDQYHQDVSQIYQVMEDQTYSNGQKLTTESTPGPLTPALVESFSEIEYASRATWGNSAMRVFKSSDMVFTVHAVDVDTSFFSIFTFEFIEGDPLRPFTSLESIVISDEIAERLFGDEPALGQILERADRSPLVVSGVFKSREFESSLRYDVLIPFEKWLQANQWATQWGNNSMRTFIKLHDDQNWRDLSEKMKGFIKANQEESVVDLFLHPYVDRYLRSDFSSTSRNSGRIVYVRIFAIVAVFILLIACINFMNLATARSVHRSREIGVRKSVGAHRGILISQFIVESLLISFISMLVALIATELALPYFNELTGKRMGIDYLNPIFLGSIGLITLVTGFVSGSYPAFYMSAFDPIHILKGTFKTGRYAVLMRHGLVVFQFVLSITLIITTIFMFRQMNYMINKDLGFQKDQIVYFTHPPSINEKFDAFRNELLKIDGVETVTRSNQNPVNVGSSTGDIKWDGMTPEESGLFQFIQSGYDFTETVKITVKDGRSFDRRFGADSSSVLINEEAARKMGMDNPVGEKLNLWDEEYTVIGVMNDFHSANLRNGIEPLILLFNPESTWMTMVRIKPNDIQATLASMRSVYTEFESRIPIEYVFMDEFYESLYRRETTISTLSQWFAGFAIFISCLGLLGLASFTAEQRSREIGIRKVMGATVPGLIALQTSSFAKLVIIACIISIPLTIYLVSNWLENFAFAIDIDPFTFIVAGLSIFAVAMLTVLWQCLRAALVNPVDVLKYE